MKALKNIILLLAVAAFFWSCTDESVDVNYDGSEGGKAGSLARFAVAGDYLYTVDESQVNEGQLKVFSLSNPEKPVFTNQKQVGFGVETIFPKGNTLFLGTQTGMYIYSIEQPESPAQLSFFEHLQACDPVVADDNYAYVTLNSANPICFRAVNELQVIDISNLSNPTLEATKTMTSPHGLAIHNDSLFVCDKGIGIRLLDVSEVNNMEQLFNIPNPEARDVIYHNNKLLVAAEDGFHQYRIAGGEITKISDILIGE